MLRCSKAEGNIPPGRSGTPPHTRSCDEIDPGGPLWVVADGQDPAKTAVAEACSPRRRRAVGRRHGAAVAAVALTEAGHEGATYTLTGPEAITHSQIAAALTAALDRTVMFIDVPPEAFADSIRELLPPWQVDGLLEDYAHYRRGEAAAVSPAIADITGTAPRSIGQFARDYAPAFAG